MRRPRQSRSHASAWDRLAPVTVEPIEDQLFRARRGLPPEVLAHAAYQEVLQRYFMGTATASAVGRARLAWCMAESRAVDRKVHEPKPLEHMSGFLRLAWRGGQT